MNILKGKYFALILAMSLLLFAAVAWVPSLSRGWIFALLGGLLLVGAVIIFVRGKRRLARKRAWGLFSVMLVLTTAATLFGISFAQNTILSVKKLDDGDPHTIHGYVEDIFYEETFGASYHIVLLETDGERQKGGVVLTTPFSSGLAVNDEVRFEGVFSDVDEMYASYYHAKGIFAATEAENVAKTGVRERGILSFLHDVRKYISDGFETYIGGDSAGFAAALLTGEREMLSGVTKLDFQRLGISHLIAVSGLHLSVIVGGLDVLLRLLTVPRRRKDLILIAFSLFFMAICGFTASVMRAALMLCVLYLADLLGERSDALTSLFFAAALIVILRPHAVFDAGLWLSFFATLGVIWVMPLCEDFLSERREDGALFSLGKRVLRAVCLLIVMNFAATCFTLPITFLLYGGISLISPLTNLLFVPMVQVLLYLVAVTALTLPIPFVASALGKTCAVYIELLTDAAHAFSEMEDIYLSLRYPFAGILVATFAIGIFMVMVSERAKLMKLSAVFFAAVIAFAGCLFVFRGIHDGRAEIFLVTDGNSDVLGVVCEGEAVLIDVTTGGKALPLEAVETMALHRECEPDALVLTHLHTLHAGTIGRLCEKVRIRTILLPAPVTEDEEAIVDLIYEAVGDAAEIETYMRTAEGETLSFSSMTLFLPPMATVSRSSHPVISFSVDIDDMPWEREICYVGSSGFEVVSDLADAPLVIAGAHGPVTKNIFEYTILSSAHTVVFSDEKAAFFTETALLPGDIRYAAGVFEIIFE